MPRGRHRHSPPLHRLLPPSAIAGVSLVCAFGPWVFSQQAVLRVIAAIAAAVAVVGAAVMRRWDGQAGRQVADLTRARASDEWRHEERVAELETDLEESRELRVKLEQRLRAKRTELAALRNEHAALLRRYATAETERASALEGRRLLEIEAAPARALPSAEEADEEAVAVAAPAEDGTDADVAAGAEGPERPTIFSPEGSQLFLRANAALKRLDEDGDEVTATEAEPTEAEPTEAEAGESEAEPEEEADTETRADSGPASRTGMRADAGGGAKSGPATGPERSADVSEGAAADLDGQPVNAGRRRGGRGRHRGGGRTGGRGAGEVRGGRRA